MPSKKTTKAKAKPKSKKSSNAKVASVEIKKQSALSPLYYGLASVLATYVFALWAIDSGSLWVYALTFASLYYSVYFLKQFVTQRFFNNVKSSKAKSAKS